MTGQPSATSRRSRQPTPAAFERARGAFRGAVDAMVEHVPTPPRKLTAAAAALALTGGMALETATADAAPRPMRPAQVMHKIGSVFGYKYEGSGASDMNFQGASISPRHLVLRGKCTPDMEKSRGSKKINDLPRVQITTICEENGKTSVDRMARSHMSLTTQLHIDYTQDVEQLGNRAAHSVGVGKASHGEARLAKASKKHAEILYRNDKTATTRQLKELILRKGRRPQKIWYR